MISKKLGTLAVLALAMVMVMTAFSTIVSAEAKVFDEEDENYETELTSKWATTLPTIDGSLGEWSWENNQTYSNHWVVPDDMHRNGLLWVFFANTEDYLYVAVDVTPDNTSDDDDYAMLLIDMNNDNAFDELNDTAISIFGDGTMFSTMGIYGAVDFEKTDQANWKHRTYEFALDLKALGLTVNDTVDMVIFGESDTPTLEWWYPAENEDGGSYPDDMITAEISMSGEPITPVVEAETTPTNVLYAMYFTLFTLVVLLVEMLGFERVWDWANNAYSKGKYWTAVFAVYGLPVILIALGSAQYYWDWIGKLFGI